jgi:hypothetical protein
MKHYPEPEKTKPESDERGRFCSFNTLCGRKCTSFERDRCYWWLHAPAVPEQQPLELTPPLSHAKDDNRGK